MNLLRVTNGDREAFLNCTPRDEQAYYAGPDNDDVYGAGGHRRLGSRFARSCRAAAAGALDIAIAPTTAIP